MSQNRNGARRGESLVRQTLRTFWEIVFYPKRGFEHLSVHPNRVRIALMMMLLVTIPYYVAYVPGYLFVQAGGVAEGWVTIWQRVVPFHSIYGFFCVTFPWYYIVSLTLMGYFLFLGLFVEKTGGEKADPRTVFSIVIFASQVPAMLDALVYEQFFVYYQLFTHATKTPGWYYNILFSMIFIMLLWMPTLYYLGFKTLYKNASRHFAVVAATSAFLLNFILNWLWWGKIPLSFYA